MTKFNSSENLSFSYKEVFPTYLMGLTHRLRQFVFWRNLLLLVFGFPLPFALIGIISGRSQFWETYTFSLYLIGTVTLIPLLIMPWMFSYSLSHIQGEFLISKWIFGEKKLNIKEIDEIRFSTIHQVGLLFDIKDDGNIVKKHAVSIWSKNPEKFFDLLSYIQQKTNKKDIPVYFGNSSRSSVPISEVNFKGWAYISSQIEQIE